ncbi:hypothetical protein M407DRAFT_28552 [Tulasnella calospora MUT 4182]|uniref:G-protein coupled receptors family 1 profile domain-containing protein n=1 Tax=Tulasnella calospora MUT 4182 TaxID=1051891 RepID=A0A0C3Q159_9AGAM|nr:hypothetical protein M407DRAFT_28552 [Tulasnella calospora MUT 4182]
MDAVLSNARLLTGQSVQLGSGTLISLLLITEAALLSQITVATLLLYVLFNAIRNHVRPPSRYGRQPWRFIRTSTDYYFFHLLFMDLIQGLGSVLHIRWIHLRTVEAESTYCSAQGFIKQLGSVGVALTTFVIAVHTFAVLFLRWKIPDTKWLPLGVIGLIWLFLILATSIPWATKDDYYYQTGYWCWINKRYGNLQYAFSGFLLYIPLFFRLRRTIMEYPEHRRQQMHIARQLLVYPIAYVIIITPISVVRKIQFTNTKKMEASGEIALGKPAVAPALVGFAGVFFSLSGFVDAILYVITRPSILHSFLSSFQSNGGPADAGAAPPAKNQHQANAPLATMPEVTINSGSGHELESREVGFPKKGRYGGYSDTEGSEDGHQQYKEPDYGLPTVTVMSENHLTPPSLRTRGTVVDYGSERPSYRRQEGTPSSAGTRYYSPHREGSSSTAAER